MESHVTKFMVTGKVYNNEEPHANSHLNDDECEEFESDKDVCGPEVFSSHILQAHILKLAHSANFAKVPPHGHMYCTVCGAAPNQVICQRDFRRLSEVAGRHADTMPPQL